MANTSYGVNHPLAVKLWAKKLFHEALKTTWAYKFMGTDQNSVIQVKEDLRKDAGDRIRVGLRMLLSGDGIQGDGTLEGNEEALTTYYDDLFIDQLRHAVRSEGKMSEQRVPFSVREEARMGLQDWWAERIDESFMNQLSGNHGVSDTRRLGNQAAITADASHVVFPASVTNEVSLTAGDTFTTAVIDKCVNKAKTLSPQIRPIRIDGGDYFVMFLHPHQVYSLRQSAATTGDWADIQKAAIQGGQITGNPIFTGALGQWNGVVLHESTRVPDGLSGSATLNLKAAIFAGAQAGCMAFGRNSGPERMSWVEEKFDYGNQLGVSAGMIYGLKKSRFNSQDFATIRVPTIAKDPNS